MSNEENTVIEPTPITTEAETVPTFLWQSIAVTCLCCIPLGIPAIVFAAKVNGLVLSGQIEEAKAASAKAKMWCWIAFGLGLLAIIGQIIVQFGAFAAILAAETQ